jgi:succinoglycan biosynthesis protein ExoA
VSTSSTAPSDEELVTVVIPAFNEEESIERCLRSIQDQHHTNLQILVVDGDSEDRTVEIVHRLAQEDPRIELIRNPDRIIPKALNLAVEAARSRWLVRIDAHAHVLPEFVSLAVEHLRSGEWGGVGGRKDGIGGAPDGDAIAAAMASKFGVGGSTYHHGTTVRTVEHIPFGAYPVDVIRELGGWDENMRVNQDFEFDYRVRQSGRNLLFDPALVIRWENRRTIADLFKQYRRYGRGKVKVARKHPESLRPRHLAAPVLLATLVGAEAAALAGKPKITWALLTPYAGILAAGTATTYRNVPAEQRGKLPLAFAAMHVGWGLGFYEGLVDIARSGRKT